VVTCAASDGPPIVPGRAARVVTTVVMFLLVPQVKLPKRLDVARAAEHWASQLPALIEQQLRPE
jgi:hypothetical protein